MFGYLVLENEMFAMPCGETQEAVGVGCSETTTPAHPAAGRASPHSSTIRESKASNLVHAPDGSTVERVSAASKWTAADLPALAGRRFVVTGANSGIGLETAKALAAHGAHVVLAVRDTASGERAAKLIAGDTEVRELDLAHLASIRSFAHDLDDVDVLINNAGVMNTPYELTADGFELQMGTNHLGHFALTNLLLGRIADRVVVVASNAHRRVSIDVDDLNSEHGYRRHRVYGQTKLANLLFASELQRRLLAAGSRITVTAAHPGLVATNLQKPTGHRIEDAAIAIFVRLFAQDSATGALPTLYAATQDLPGDSYVGPDGPREKRGHPKLVGRSAAAQDAAVAARLWDESERLTGVSFPRGAL